jgi:pyruvate dehydrogenase E1 component beta subunit
MPVVAKFPYQAELFFVEYVYNQIGKIRSMTGGQAGMTIVIWISGSRRGQCSSGQHTDVGCEVVYAYMAGIKVVDPSNAYDARDSDRRNPRSRPRSLSRLQRVASGDQPDVPDEAYEVPIGKAVVRQEGKDLTIVAWAPATVDVAIALPNIAKAGISAEYIDPRTLKPLELDTLVTSAKKTGRMLVVDHGNYTASFSSHVIAEVVQKVPGVKCAKIAYPDAPGPGNAGMMAWMRPDAPKILDAAQKIMKI